MLLPDVNVLIYAFRKDVPQHAVCRAWFDSMILDDARFGISRLALSGPRVTDAWFAALAIECGCEWVTTDRDYARFPGLKWSVPAIQQA
jgi:predicted nucleic acid-binding protein